MTSKTPERNPGLDLLRGLSIVLVVMHHVGIRIPLRAGLLAGFLPKRCLDALIYNGYEAATVTAHGAAELGIHHLRSGIITRGVLVDVPAIRGTEALEPGEPVFPEDLESAERTTGVTVQSGDALLVRTGRWRWRESHGPSSPSDGLAGLDASCLSWLHEREVAVLGSDGISDPMPFVGTPQWPFPVHQIGIVSMGLHLIDNVRVAPLAIEMYELEKTP